MSITIKEIQVKLSVEKSPVNSEVTEELVKKVKALVLKEIKNEAPKYKTLRKDR